MRVLVVVVLGLLSLFPVLAPPAEAQYGPYAFSWHSQVDGETPDGEPAGGVISGRSIAFITETPSTVIIDFDTPVGPARVEIQREDFGISTYATQIPFEFPQIAGGEGRRLYECGCIAGYSWAGQNPFRPETFRVFVALPGSGPSPNMRFVGAGALEAYVAWIRGPLDGSTISGTVPLGLTSNGGTGVARTYRLYVDDVLISTQPVTNGGGASFAWNTTTVPNGPHRLLLEVEDEAGDRVGDLRQVTVSNATAPSVTFNLTRDQVIRSSVPVQISVSGLAAGNKRYFILVDGTQVAFRIITANTTTWWWNTGNYTNGTHTLRVRVVDVNGREAVGEVRVIIAN